MSVERTYLDMLRSELAQYEASKARAAELLANDDAEYRAKVVAGWDHVIAKQRATIRKEEERHATLSPD